MSWRTFAALLLIFNSGAPSLLGAGPPRFRSPAPLEDGGPQEKVPVFGRAAGHVGTDATLGVMEWVAKRTWHVLALPYERKDFTGPPSLEVRSAGGWIQVEETVVDGGVPLRNQVIACQAEQLDEPLLMLLRSTDAFGEVLIELDLKGGKARSRSVTVSRSMVGGQSHSSPMPEQSSHRVIRAAEFPPRPAGPTDIEITALGSRITLRAGGEEVLTFEDPDPAGGKFGFGSTGRMRLRDVQQWELVSPREVERRKACIEDMHAFARKVDLYYDDDVRERNQVEAREDGILWSWKATGATARLRVDGPRVVAAVRSGLYGNDLLLDGPLPEVTVLSAQGETYRADPQGKAALEGDSLGLRMRLPLRSEAGGTAVACVLARLTVQTVWCSVTTRRPASMQRPSSRKAASSASSRSGTAGSASPRPTPGSASPRWSCRRNP
jgi:hypothetical protein